MTRLKHHRRYWGTTIAQALSEEALFGKTKPLQNFDSSPDATPQLLRHGQLLGTFPPPSTAPHQGQLSLVCRASRRDVFSPLSYRDSSAAGAHYLVYNHPLRTRRSFGVVGSSAGSVESNPEREGERNTSLQPVHSPSIPSASPKGQGQGRRVVLCCPGQGESPPRLTQTLEKKKALIHEMTIHAVLLSNSFPPLQSINNIFLSTFNSTPIR